MLDQQVVRSALKSHKEASRKSFDVSDLSPFSSYLRLLRPGIEPLSVDERNPEAWKISQNIILVLEWRAALLVAARASSSSEVYSDQRISRAVSDAFIAAQIGEIISSLPLQAPERFIVSKLLTLVSTHSASAGRRLIPLFSSSILYALLILHSWISFRWGF